MVGLHTMVETLGFIIFMKTKKMDSLLNRHGLKDTEVEMVEIGRSEHMLLHIQAKKNQALFQ
jgi:hypothetical protein